MIIIGRACIVKEPGGVGARPTSPPAVQVSKKKKVVAAAE